MQDLALKSYYVFRKPELITQALANADWQQLAFRFRVSLLSWHCVHLFTQQSCYGWLYIKQTLNLHFVGGLKELLNTVSTPAACQSLQDIKAGSFSRLKDEMLVFHSGSRWAPNTAHSEGGQKTVRCFLRRHEQGTVSEKHDKHNIRGKCCFISLRTLRFLWCLITSERDSRTRLGRAGRHFSTVALNGQTKDGLSIGSHSSPWRTGKALCGV